MAFEAVEEQVEGTGRSRRRGEGPDAARDLVATAPRAELFLYPGDKHLFADSSLPDYDADAAALLGQRVLSFLDAVA